MQWSILSPISRHNRKSFWTPVNSERFGVSDVFNESSDCFQVQGLQFTILLKTKVVLLFQCEPRTPASRWRHLLKLNQKK